MQLKWLVWEKFSYFFLICFLKVQLYLCIYLSQVVCLNFARTLGRAVVVEWFKGNSDVTDSHFPSSASAIELCDFFHGNYYSIDRY